PAFLLTRPDGRHAISGHPHAHHVQPILHRIDFARSKLIGQKFRNLEVYFLRTGALKIPEPEQVGPLYSGKEAKLPKRLGRPANLPPDHPRASGPHRRPRLPPPRSRPTPRRRRRPTALPSTSRSLRGKRNPENSKRNKNCKSSVSCHTRGAGP